MKQLLKNIKLLSMCLVVVSFLGCEDDDEGNLPEVIAGFTFTLNEDTATVTFINISEEANAFEWDFGDGETSTLINPIKAYSESGTYTVSLEASNVAGASGVFEDEITIQIADPTAPFDSGLLNNGDFENGTEPWIGGGLNVATEGGNSFNLVDVTVAGNPFDVNLSQVVEITQGTNYILTFDASASVNRTMLAGIGLNEAPFTNTALSVNLTTDTQTFTLQLSAADFGGANSRVLFDMGAEVGIVVIDNVSLVEGGDGSDSNVGDGPEQGAIDDACAGSSLEDFETADNGIFSDFGGGTAVIIDNPNTTVNMSAKVGQMQKFNAEPFGGTTMTLDAPVDFSNGEVFTMDVFSQRVAALTFKLEGLNIERVINTSGTGWETMTFDFTGETTGAAVPSITLIFDNGTNGDAEGDPDAWTFLFDNLRLCDSDDTGGGSDQGSIDDACAGSELEDYETADNGIFSDFGGGTAVIIDNPNTTVNMSAKVGQMQKFNAEPFGGTTMTLDAPVDFSNGEVFTMDVFSQRVAALTFKLEGLNIERVINTSGTGWETMTFDFTGETTGAAVPSITLIFDNGTNGDAEGDPDAWTFLFDNLRLCDSDDNGGSGGGCTDTLIAATALPLNFEGCETFLASQNFGAGLTSDLVANPFKTGINTSDFVLQVVKPAGSDFFAGVQNTFASNFDLTTTDTFKFKVYSTKANVVFRFELALNPQTDPVTGNPAPVFVTIPNANEWTEVEVTFTGLPGGPTAYNQLVIKPDNAQGDPAITVDGTYYIDDIILE